MGKLPDQTGDDWAEIAKMYKQLTDGVAAKPLQTLVSRINALSPFSQATAIHDNGCGTGHIISRIIQGHSSQIPADCMLTASDFSKPMIEQIQATKNEEVAKDPDSLWKKVELSIQDAMDLKDIPSDSKSHVTAGWVYFMTPSPEKCLQESLRILAPNGVLACSSWQDSQWLQVMNLASVIRPDMEMARIPEEWKSAAGVESELRKAGFRDVEAREVEVEMHFDRVEALVELLTTKLPHMINMLKEFSPEEMERLREAMRKKIREYCASEPGTLTGVSLVALGRK